MQLRIKRLFKIEHFSSWCTVSLHSFEVKLTSVATPSYAPLPGIGPAKTRSSSKLPTATEIIKRILPSAGASQPDSDCHSAWPAEIKKNDRSVTKRFGNRDKQMHELSRQLADYQSRIKLLEDSKLELQKAKWEETVQDPK